MLEALTYGRQTRVVVLRSPTDAEIENVQKGSADFAFVNENRFLTYSFVEDEKEQVAVHIEHIDIKGLGSLSKR